MRSKIVTINNFIQLKLLENSNRIILKEAAKLLDELNILKDSVSSPGFPLRRLAQKNLIMGAYKEDGKWFIKKVDDYREILSSTEVAKLLKLKNRNSIYGYIRRHKVPYHQLANGQIVFLRDEFFNWMVHQKEKEKKERKRMFS